MLWAISEKSQGPGGPRGVGKTFKKSTVCGGEKGCGLPSLCGGVSPEWRIYRLLQRSIRTEGELVRRAGNLQTSTLDLRLHASHGCGPCCKHEDTSCTCACVPAGFPVLREPGCFFSHSTETEMQDRWSPLRIVRAEFPNPGSPGPDAAVTRQETWHLSRAEMQVRVHRHRHSGSGHGSWSKQAQGTRAAALWEALGCRPYQCTSHDTCPNDRVLPPGPVRPIGFCC